MFLLCSVATNRRRSRVTHEMNAVTATRQAHAPSPAAAHHMGLLSRLADLGMELAELAATQARHQAPAPCEMPPEMPPAPGVSPERRPDPFLSFARAARIVTQAAALHATLEAGPQTQRQTRPAEPPPDIRREILQGALGHAVSHTNIPAADAHEALEEHLADDLSQIRYLQDVFDSVCQAINLDMTGQKLPPEYQGMFDYEIEYQNKMQVPDD